MEMMSNVPYTRYLVKKSPQILVPEEKSSLVKICFIFVCSSWLLHLLPSLSVAWILYFYRSIITVRMVNQTFRKQVEGK